MDHRNRSGPRGAARTVRLGGVVTALALAACVVQPIAPDDLRALGPQGEAALERLDRAVALANAFLASDARATLPPGTLAWRGDRLVFAHPEGTDELYARRTTFGDVVERFGFEAQERSNGFVVGARGDGDPRVANSLFVGPDGAPKGTLAMAELLLHELTHVHFRDGTVAVCETIAYYAEAILLLRYADHSAERRPYATSREVVRWARGPG